MSDDDTARPAPGDPPAPRPLGLTLLMWLYAFWAVAAALVLVAAALGGGEVAIEGRTLERETALEIALPIFLPLALAGGALALWLEMHWARAALLLPIALAAVLPALVAGPAGQDPARRIITGIGIMAIPGLLLAGYLWGRASVRAYFDPSG